MKAIVIHFTDGQGKATKTYSTVSIKTGLVDRIFDLAATARELENGSEDLVLIRQFFGEVKAVIVALFGNQFTYDELQDGVHRRFEYKLCPACQRQFLTNPLGVPRKRREGEN
jgi:hypothetical protein